MSNNNQTPDDELVYLFQDEAVDENLKIDELAAFANGPVRLEFVKYWHDETRRSRPLSEVSTKDLEEMRQSACSEDFSIEVLDEHLAMRANGEPLKTENLDFWLGETPEDRYFIDFLLGVYEGIQEGDILAAFSGILGCRDRCIPPPDWICSALLQFLSEVLSGRSLGAKGRGNSFAGALEQNVKDFERVNMVDQIRSVQRIYRHLQGFPFLEELVSPPVLAQLVKEKKIDGFGTTVEDAIDLAEIALRGTRAQASRKTIRDVYYNRQRGKLKYPPEIMDLVGGISPVTFGSPNSDCTETEINPADQHYLDNPPPPAK